MGLLQIFCVILVVAQFVLPLRLAFAPLLIAAFHFPNLPVVDIGGNFTICRLVVAAGLLRAGSAKLLVWSPRCALDVLVAAWSCWIIVSASGHTTFGGCDPLMTRLGIVFESFGGYLYARAYVKNCADFVRLTKCLALVILPLAVLMLVEKITGQDIYALVGANFHMVRQGHLRVAGPFGNAILAGTVGGASLPLLLVLFQQNRTRALVGIIACVAVVYSSASSGPFMTLAVGLAGAAFWRLRAKIGQVVKFCILGLIVLQVLMSDPVWYLMARIDITGGSTGSYRAELITQAFNHLDEWWLFGTDYTRHWMAYGLEGHPDQSDIANGFLKMGVLGGLISMCSFIAIVVVAFKSLANRIRTVGKQKDPREFIFWCLGACLFAHVVSFFGVSYFDQTNVVFFLLVGVVAGLCSTSLNALSSLRRRRRPEMHPYDRAAELDGGARHQIL